VLAAPFTIGGVTYPNLTTERLTLRPFIESDIEARHRYRRLGDVSRYLYQAPLTVEQSRKGMWDGRSAFRFSEDGDDLLLAVETRSEPRIVGEVVLKLANATAAQAEIGWIFDPMHGGKGYATEAAGALMAWGFEEFEAHRVFARLDALNVASERLCQRLGMRREAHLVENDRDGDRWGSEYVYAILRREFAASR